MFDFQCVLGRLGAQVKDSQRSQKAASHRGPRAMPVRGQALGQKDLGLNSGAPSLSGTLPNDYIPLGLVLICKRCSLTRETTYIVAGRNK